MNKVVKINQIFHSKMRKDSEDFQQFFAFISVGN